MCQILIFLLFYLLREVEKEPNFLYIETMKFLIKLIIFQFAIFSFTISFCFAVQLDIGEDINFEYRFAERGGETVKSELRQNIKFYLTGYLRDDIEIGAKIRSAGTVNSTNTVVFYEGQKLDNLSPFFEHAYVRIHNYYDLPVSISLGIMPFKWADGVLINDRETGLPAALIEARDIYFDISADAFYSFSRDSTRNISDIEGYGFRAFRDFGIYNLELNFLHEDYFSTDSVRRNVYGGSFSRELSRGLEFSLFGFLMDGEKGDESFTADAFGANGHFQGEIDPLGSGGAWINYAVASGNLDDDEMGFSPLLAGVDSSFICEFYGGHREHMRIDGAVDESLTLSNSIANLSMLRTGLYADILDDLTVHMVRSTFKRHTPDVPIGGSITFGCVYNYSFLEFELNYTIFSPEEEYDYYTSDENTTFINTYLRARF